VASLAAITPLLVYGSPAGDDFRFHFSLWLDAVQQWHEGVILPQWQHHAVWGYGQPTFLFYPPLSWLLGSALVFLFPLKMAPGSYLFLVFFLAGCSMFLFARDWVPPPHATLAAILYIASPYLLLCAYKRTAMGELLAAAIFPLVLRFALRLDKGPQAIVPLAFALAASWLSNLPAAVITTYSVALILLLLAVVGRTLALVLYGALATAGGLALSAFVLLPAMYEMPWIKVSFRPDFQTSASFMFDWGRHVSNGWFFAKVSVIALIEIGLALAGICFCWLRRRKSPAVWMIMTGLAVVSAIMLFPVAAFLYATLPELRHVQFAWRWLFVLSACGIFLLVTACRETRIRALFPAAVILVLVSGALAAGKVPWRSRLTAQEEHLLQTGTGLVAAEYLPVNAEPLPATGEVDAAARAKIDTPRAVFLSETGPFTATPASQIKIQEWSSRRKFLTIHNDSSGNMVLRVFYYPGWRAWVNNKPVLTAPQPETGQLMLPIPSGHNQVEVRFVRTPDRIAAAVISLVALFLAAGYATWIGRIKN
jgi:hypothetical protein